MESQIENYYLNKLILFIIFGDNTNLIREDFIKKRVLTHKFIKVLDSYIEEVYDEDYLDEDQIDNMFSIIYYLTENFPFDEIITRKEFFNMRNQWLNKLNLCEGNKKDSFYQLEFVKRYGQLDCNPRINYEKYIIEAIINEFDLLALILGEQPSRADYSKTVCNYQFFASLDNIIREMPTILTKDFLISIKNLIKGNSLKEIICSQFNFDEKIYVLLQTKKYRKMEA